MGKGGGGGQPAPVQQTVNNTSIPEYARPYVESMLGQTQALTDINQNPYQTYGGERIAGFNNLQISFCLDLYISRRHFKKKKNIYIYIYACVSKPPCLRVCIQRQVRQNMYSK